MRLDDATVSRRHAQLTIAPLAHQSRVGTLQDLGSRNGTWVDGAPVTTTSVALGPGAVIRMGDVVGVLERRPAEGPLDPPLAELPGDSAAVVELRAAVRRHATSPAAVLVQGETGTGKEFVARALHRLSGRSGPFVAVNCAALSPHLIESQLFGHARGAFTGAHAAAPGVFRAAQAGTLLLDEIGELPLELQPKLLRVLQENEIQPVGESKPVPVDVRIVAATLVDLGTAVERGAFRRDLYARLRITEIRVPALRERRSDVLAWLSTMARRWSPESDARARLSADFVERLLLDPWPENLRGLDRIAHLLAREPDGLALALPPLNPPPAREPPESPEAAAGRDVDAMPGPRPAKPTRDEMLDLWQRHEGSVHALARVLDRDRRQIYRWLAEYGIERS